MKLNKKGFLLLETLIVAVFTVTIFTFLFQSVVPLAGLLEQKVIQNGNVNTVYSLYHIRKFLKTDTNFTSITNQTYGQITCNDLSNKEYCDSLTEALNLSYLKGTERVYTFDLYYIKGFSEATATSFINSTTLNVNDAVKSYVKNYETSISNLLILYDQDNDAVSIIGLDTENFSCFKYKKIGDPDAGKFYITIYENNSKEYKYYHVLTGDDTTALNNCVNYFKNLINPINPTTKTVYDDETISNFCKLDSRTKIVENMNFIDKYVYNDYDPLFFKEAVHAGFMESVSESQIPDSQYSYMLVSYDDSCSRNVTLEDTYNGKKIVRVGYQVFKNKNMKSVTLGSNIKIIDKQAFFGMNESNIKLINNKLLIDYKSNYTIIGSLVGE